MTLGTAIGSGANSPPTLLKKVRYSGNWLKNKFSGTGTQYYESGTLWYEGSHLAGLYNGFGVLYSFTGKIMYRGTQAFGVKDGFGIEYDTDTDFKIYEGEYSQDSYEGRGKNLFFEEFALPRQK